MDSTLRTLFAIFLIASFHGFCFSEKVPFYNFMREATEAAPVSYYDYIIIGGGTAGCPLAATLSQNATVLVLERGRSPYEIPEMTKINHFVQTLLDPSPDSPAQQFVSEDGVFNHRARVLGGGSVINAGIYSKASTRYVRKAGWDEALVNSSYQWVEEKLVFQPQVLQWQSAVRDGLLEAGILPDNGFSFEHIQGTKFCGTIFDETGQRHTAADLLEFANPKKISVYLHATVGKIIFLTTVGPRPKANGVEFQDGAGGRHVALLNKGSKNEIILAAGAIGSPQMLMLSGVGPAALLRELDIEVLADFPNVGQGMADNPMNALIIPSPLPVEISLGPAVGISPNGIIEALSGMILNPKMVKRLSKDLAKFLNKIAERLPNSTLNIGNFFGGDAMLGGGALFSKVMGPISRGYMKLGSKDPNDTPLVKFNYFQSSKDLKRCVKGVKNSIKVANSRAMSRFKYKEISVKALMNLMSVLPLNLRSKNVQSATSLKHFCNDTVVTMWHFHGGCRVGEVVDRDFRVIGIDALRVVDGSTLAATPGTNPHATLMMLGRYMGQRILHDRMHGYK